MKTFKNILVVALIALTAIACKDNAQPEVKTIETEANTAQSYRPKRKICKSRIWY